MRMLWPVVSLLSSMIVHGQSVSEQQQEAAREMGDKVQRFEMWTDDAGQVTELIFINHQSLTKSAGEKVGIADGDLLNLQKFPKLTALNLEAQPVGDRGIQALRMFPGLKQIGFHYMAKAKGANASPDFITVIDGMRELEILEIKHNFRMKAIHVHKLRGPFPNVWRLVLDTPLTAEQTMHMIELCPNVTDLQLHRTRVSASQLTRIGKLLPKLEVFWLKPEQGIQPEQLVALSRFQQLRIFSPQSFRRVIPYQSGWDSLLGLPHLQRLEMSESVREKNAQAISRLQKNRPSLHIDTRLTRSRNYEGL